VCGEREGGRERDVVCGEREGGRDRGVVCGEREEGKRETKRDIVFNYMRERSAVRSYRYDIIRRRDNAMARVEPAAAAEKYCTGTSSVGALSFTSSTLSHTHSITHFGPVPGPISAQRQRLHLMCISLPVPFGFTSGSGFQNPVFH